MNIIEGKRSVGEEEFVRMATQERERFKDTKCRE